MINSDNGDSKLRVIDEEPKRIFAVGDIHGCSRELEAMLEHLVGVEKVSDEDLIVFIGDYVDRGPDSRGVIELLLAIQDDHPNTIFLKGNHEDMLLSYLGYPGNMGEVYLFNGGKDFFSSYAIKEEQFEDVIDLLPKSHLAFLLNLESYVEVGEYIFAHAGLDPARDLHSQLDSDLYWIRDAFIANIHNFNKVVVFGHTPYHEVMLDLPYKIGIDTGLVYGNKLTCLELLSRSCLQIEHGERAIKRRALPEFGPLTTSK